MKHNIKWNNNGFISHLRSLDEINKFDEMQ